jgi:hypothetical protein
LQGTEAVAFVAGQSARILTEVQLQCGDIQAVSAGAEGSDTIFAEAAIAVGIPLVLVRPFRGYEADFADAPSRDRYLRSRQHAHREVGLRYLERSPRAYLAAMEWIVSNSDLLLAAWDGQPGGGYGGTADAVARAKRGRRPWLHLDVVNFLVKNHASQTTSHTVLSR